MNADQHAGAAILIGLLLAIACVWALYDLLFNGGKHLGPAPTDDADVDVDEQAPEPLRLPYVCPDCGARSFHPEDARQGYCGRCHRFTGRPAGLDIPTDDTDSTRRSA